MLLSSILSFFSVLFASQKPEPYTNSLCFNSIQKLANYDKCLSSRLFLKLAKARQANNADEFFSLTSADRSKCNGLEFLCGNTVSWVSEVFEGLRTQYIEYKQDYQGDAAGWKSMIGNEIINLFSTNRNSNRQFIYRLRHNGTEDHVWIIEQLSSNLGYRIYQSYNDAYSLKAWLSKSLNGLYNATSGEIMLLNKLKFQVNRFIQLFSNGQLNINSNIDNAASIPNAFKPFIKYVQDYNETTATNNFARSWNKYGKGQILQWDTMSSYLQILGNMTTYLTQNVNTTNLFSEKIYNDWIDLFGSPNPLRFPNLPYNAISENLFTGRAYRFEIKTVMIEQGQNCPYNSDFINNV